MTVSGHTFAGRGVAKAVTVRATTGAREIARVEADDSGKYLLRADVQRGDVVVVAYELDGHATAFRSVESAPAATFTFNVVLRALDPLSCSGGGCSLGKELNVRGLPEHVSGSARVFNPATETDAFPGPFGDSKGDLLISSVFTAVELRDAAGKRVESLERPAELALAVPREAWGVLTDVIPANAKIDVPLYSFDPGAGTWVREGEAVLQDAAGKVLPESALAAIRNGTRAGDVLAVGNVRHFSYWNIDFPVATHACLVARLVDADGKPAAGASVLLRGLSYSGWSQPVTADENGRVCVRGMRTEGPEDDFDYDGIRNETQTVSLFSEWKGGLHEIASRHTMPAASATCPSDACTDLGEIALKQPARIEECRIAGRVRGTGAAGAEVIAYDESVPVELPVGDGGIRASQTAIAIADAKGRYSLTVRLVRGVQVTAFGKDMLRASDAWMAPTPAQSRVIQVGNRAVNGCPDGPIDITLSSRGEITPTLAQRAPRAIATAIATVPRPAAIAGQFRWGEEVTGLVRAVCDRQERTTKITDNSFELRNVPSGSCRVTFELEGARRPAVWEGVVSPGETLLLDGDVFEAPARQK